MPPATTKPSTQRKRNRKRKRRAASTSSSSSDSCSSDSNEDEAPKTTQVLVSSPSQPQLESDSSLDSDSSESSSSDEEDTTTEIPRGRQPQNVTPKTRRQISLSPPPPSTVLPSFLPSENAGDDAGSKEKELKDRFRQFWMTSVADGFKDDLEEIRKVYRCFICTGIHTVLLICRCSRNLTLEPHV